MPRLLFFIPCSRPITEAQTGLLSLIAVIDGFQVQVSHEEVQPNAVIPVSWSAIATWLRIPSDEGKRFEQRITIVMPDGSENVDGSATFEMPNRIHRQTTNLNAFPIGQVGEYRLLLSLRDVAEDDNWTVVADYPIVVEHIKGERG